MLNLKPLMARLVEDVLRAIGEATLQELEGVKVIHRAALARSTRRSHRRAPPRRGPSRVTRPASPADTHSPSDEALEPPELCAITRPEDLLVATSHSAGTEPALGPTVDDEVVPLRRVKPVDGPTPTPTLRAGESVVRATAAGVVIRRAGSR